MGRPSKLSAEVHAKIVELLKGGWTVRAASLSLGLDDDRVNEWIRRGAKEAGGPYRELHDAVEPLLPRAAAPADAAPSRRRGRAPEPANVWFFLLARRFPDLYGERSSLREIRRIELEKRRTEAEAGSVALRRLLLERLAQITGENAADA